MDRKRSILIVGGGTAGWLTAAYLAKSLELSHGGRLEITLVESPEIGIIGVGEGTFPTIRTTLQFLGIDEMRFIRQASATFKQGIRFVDWLHTPDSDKHSHYFHPFEAPFYSEEASLVPYWLLQDEATRPPFAEAVTFQNRVAEAKRGPKRPNEGDYQGPLNYAYHFDAVKLSQVQADLYIDCTGFRAELIDGAMKVPFKSARKTLFTNRALACKIPYDKPDAPLESYTIATAHEAGWIWDIGLNDARGIGCVYSSYHIEEILRGYVGAADFELNARKIEFETGYRERHWVKNCVAVGLSGGFLEPLESTGLVLIEAAIGMIAELFPHNGPIDAPARRFNALMTARYDTIINFLKLHYCLSQRTEPFWRNNANPESIPAQLSDLLEQWRYRPPGRFDFTLDVESFAFFNYQYILYGMGFKTDLSPGRSDYPNVAAAAKTFAKIKGFGERATLDLPAHRALIGEINARDPDRLVA